ncbi:MAG: hypothetical protein KC478_08360 [Bacteriovoracaceae bacterium]|nr:hypothetical protein [Bacteriovoracaceae bacterium]
MIRSVFYIGLVGLVAGSVAWKIGVIKDKRNAPTISINNEYKKYGKPVETFNIKKDDLLFYERVTGEYSNKRVELMVSKIQWNKIQKGQMARILSANNKFVKGIVAQKNAFADTNTGLYKVVVKSYAPVVPQAGKNVVVDVNIKTLHNVIAVPSTSIVRDGKSNFVWMLKDKKAVKREVTKGQESQMYVQVTKGLSVGENIIVRGASTLEKGDVARIVSGEQK